MTFDPQYGNTLVDNEDLAQFTEQARDLLGDSVTQADLYDLEQAIQVQVTEDLLTQVLDESLAIEDMLHDHFLRDLHAQLYGDIWTWAGQFRLRETNIGVAPEMIAVELRNALDDLRYRWRHTDDLTPRQLGITAHAATVRIHPFVDGNGRTTRLLADLLFAAAQDDEPLQQYDWQLDKANYIARLREYDRTRDATELAAFVAIHPA